MSIDNTNKSINVCYQGIPGSFTYQAAVKYFPEQIDLYGAMSFKEIFHRVTQGLSNFGVIPIENSTAGSIIENYDLLRANSLMVIGEQYLSIAHHMLVVTKAIENNYTLKQIKKVFSHPKALEQCEKLLQQNAHIEVVQFSDTARAAKFVADSQNPEFAAIASKTACELYNLHMLVSDIHDERSNTTRFLIISKPMDEQKNAEKCSLIFELPHTPGSLLKVFQVLNQFGANVMKIESRPVKDKSFEYFFFLDFILPNGFDTQIINILKNHTKGLSVLGWYPQCRTTELDRT